LALYHCSIYPTPPTPFLFLCGERPRWVSGTSQEPPDIAGNIWPCEIFQNMTAQSQVARAMSGCSPIPILPLDTAQRTHRAEGCRHKVGRKDIPAKIDIRGLSDTITGGTQRVPWPLGGKRKLGGLVSGPHPYSASVQSGSGTYLACTPFLGSELASSGPSKLAFRAPRECGLEGKNAGL
jgi:hypothetical protein